MSDVATLQSGACEQMDTVPCDSAPRTCTLYEQIGTVPCDSAPHIYTLHVILMSDKSTEERSARAQHSPSNNGETARGLQQLNARIYWRAWERLKNKAGNLMAANNPCSTKLQPVNVTHRCMSPRPQTPAGGLRKCKAWIRKVREVCAPGSVECRAGQAVGCGVWMSSCLAVRRCFWKLAVVPAYTDVHSRCKV